MKKNFIVVVLVKTHEKSTKNSFSHYLFFHFSMAFSEIEAQIIFQSLLPLTCISWSLFAFKNQFSS